MGSVHYTRLEALEFTRKHARVGRSERKIIRRDYYERYRVLTGALNFEKFTRKAHFAKRFL
jgi:hypothetical protein